MTGLEGLYCRQCGTRGKRRYRTPKFDPRGLRQAMSCPQCGHKWDDLVRHVYVPLRDLYDEARAAQREW